MKACKSCNNIQSLDCYHDEPRSKDGKKHQCKTCISSHLKTKYSLNIERMRERNKAWQEANPDKVFAKHLRLTYNLNRKWLEKATKGLVSSANVFAAGSDLFVLTNYSGIDVVGNSNSASLGGTGGVGFDMFAIAAPRGISFGLNVTF